MITTVLHEQLGNQLFQWATGFSLAKRHNTKLRLITTNYGRSGYFLWLNRFPISADFINPIPGLVFEKLTGRPLYTAQRYSTRFGDRRGEDEADQNTGTFRAKFHDLPDGTLLNGMFQSWRYFSDFRTQIREEIDFRNIVHADTTKRLLEEVRSTESVSIHVRRTDYLAPGNRDKYNTCTGSYYEKAIHFMKNRYQDARFYVFSDDIYWCKSNFTGKEFTFCSETGPQGPLHDFHIMSACRHHIIANSTFSWWSAFLSDAAGQTVLCPSIWTLTGDAPISDKLYPGWIPIETKQ